MKFDVFDKSGKILESLELSDGVFAIVPNMNALNQYIRVFSANQRQGTSSTKTRGEVSGGGKKPWRQKGTGRARVGSSRVPLWRHGGISHGPKPRNWCLSIPKKLKRLAVLSALSLKASMGSIRILDTLILDHAKTKTAVELFSNLNLYGKSLVVLDTNDLNFRKSVANIYGVSTSLTNTLNAFEIIRSKNLILSKASALALVEKYI